jgi:hypothetical protein
MAALASNRSSEVDARAARREGPMCPKKIKGVAFRVSLIIIEILYYHIPCRNEGIAFSIGCFCRRVDPERGL